MPVRLDLLSFQVDAFHFCLQEFDGRPAKYLGHRLDHGLGRQGSRRNLMEERREEEMVLAADDRDIRRVVEDAAEVPGGIDPAEAGADDDDVRFGWHA